MKINFSQVVILWVASLVFIYYFQKGFLLARLALPDISQEDESNTLSGISAKHNKIVIMLIDALRFDFICPEPQLVSYNDGQINKNFHLNMPAMSDRVKKAPLNARLLHFTADPPTTTLQRLQALLTGSLPTFIDAASNFNSDKLQEDNWVRQAAKKHKILFFGDDTWIQTLGYDHFVDGSEGYESFEVWDLDTVDRSIDRRIWKYFEQENLDQWDVMITHWLGIDHAGHIYGPDHSEMKRKQIDLNQAVDKVISKIDKLDSLSNQENVLLLVFGDHGMNSQGDHGGDSLAEVDAGLFVYSALPVFQQGQVSSTSGVSLSYDEISQIDLVPTLCALLGVPIPFSNLGFFNVDLIKSLMTFKADDQKEQLNSLAKRNYKQILKYLDTYSIHSRLDFDGQQFGESIKDFPQLLQAGKSILEKLRHIWARFNLDLMLLAQFGLLLIILVFSALSGSELQAHLNGILLVVTFGTVLGVSMYNLQVLDASRSDLILISSLVSLLVSILLRQRSSVVIWNRSYIYSLSINTLPVLLALIHCFIYTSNSLVVHEDHVCVYLLQSVLVLCLVRGVKPKWKIISAMLIIRYLSELSSCREEKGRQCLNTFKAHPLSLVKDLPLLSPQYLSDYQHSIQLGIVILLSSICIYLSRSFGKISFISLCKYAFILTFIAFYWSVDGNAWFMDVRCQGILIHHILMCICMFLSGAWFLWFLVSLQFESMTNVCDLIPIMHCIASCAQSLPGVNVLSLVTIACQLLVSTAHDQESDYANSEWQVAVFYLLGNVAFFATGHQAAFSSIQFESGFIGLEAFNFYLSGGLVILNSIGGWLLCTAALVVSFYRNQNNAVQSKWKTFLLILLVDTTMSCIFTAQFRRHLMVWKVFAPRFMLAAVDFIIRGGVSVFLYLCIKQDGTQHIKDQQ
ncbi:hypothetical protein MIR68_011162 [Amoeboaphelidium protococcarum]|nr:hypothetical protein MIR68_011162 [Amoeboaphelidium protococcarum]